MRIQKMGKYLTTGGDPFYPTKSRHGSAGNEQRSVLSHPIIWNDYTDSKNAVRSAKMIIRS